MIVVKPLTLVDAGLVSTDVQELTPALYNAGTTYALDAVVGVDVGAGKVDVYISKTGSNTGNTPASSPTFWLYKSFVYKAYNAGTTYPLGERVQDNTTHKIYESLAAGNVGNAVTNTTKWIYVSPTNRWKPFDTSNSSAVEMSTSFSYTLLPGVAIATLGVLNANNVTEVRVRMDDPVYGVVYDRTTNMAALPTLPTWWHWFFGERASKTQLVLNDLPAYPNAELIIDFVGLSTMQVGVILYGQQFTIGNSVKYGARVGIKDYSRKEENAFGDTILDQRAFSDRASFSIDVPKADVDAARRFLAGLRATPALFIGSTDYESTVIFGFYRDFDIMIDRVSVSDCSIEIEGMT